MELLLVAKLCSTLCNLMNCSHTRLPCPPLSPGVCSNSCPLSWWCHPTISSSVTLFFSCPKSSPASGSFLMSQLFASGSQSIGASALASVFPMDIQGWLPWGLVGFISLLSKGLSRVFSSTTVWKHQFFSTQPSGPTLISIHDYWKNHNFNYMDFCPQSDVTDFNMLSRSVIAFLPRSKLSVNFVTAVTVYKDFVAQEKKNLSLFPLFFHLSAMKRWDQIPWS